MVRGEVAWRAVEVAGGASVMAEVADVNAAETEGLPAAGRELTVSGVGQPVLPLSLVVDAEEPDFGAQVATEVGDRWIVGTEDHLGSLGQCRQPGGDGRRRRFQLAVAIELIAEQIGDHNHPGRGGADDAGQAGPVDPKDRPPGPGPTSPPALAPRPRAC